ncbi:MAG: protein translocase subunit SecF [Negativicutes bacterium]|nr:protein translocase subunit SecF [Negativicutes bacterium]MBP8629192.1 protein translocase subunit SecF [Negativicutes bacterium]MBP9537239.1 protein translocase subunit SecF [Negativicutes bacterium]MBP9949530.1 protein translocase subunit SecF [Negativicutes bacterium]
MKNFNIIGKRKIWYMLSLLFIIPGIISIFVQGFNLGIDFTGGTIVELKFAKPVTVLQVRDTLKDYGLENSTIQLAGKEHIEASEDVFVRTTILPDETRRAVLDGMKEKLGEYQVLRTEKVGAVIGSELTLKAVLAMLISWVIIIMYISYRFELKFALSAIAALLHDIIIVMGVFSLLQKEIDGSFVAAIMTIIGYSINDTIVIFDRIRENLKLHFRKGGDLIELINHSIMQTMTRSIYTVLTVLFTVVSLFVFGGETTKNFALALLIGISCGAYSSIFNASPLWYDLKRMADKKAN